MPKFQELFFSADVGTILVNWLSFGVMSLIVKHGCVVRCSPEEPQRDKKSGNGPDETKVMTLARKNLEF
jgi:hypothetical protein